MNQVLLGLAFQDSAPDDQQMWIIAAVVLVILFFIVVIVAVGLVIFFIMRKRSKALKASLPSDASLPTGPSASAYAGMSQPEAPYASASQPEAPYAGASQPETPYTTSRPESPYATSQPETPYTTSQPESPYATSQPEPAYAATPNPETAETLDPDQPSPFVGSLGHGYSPDAAPEAATEVFDPSRTVAIIRETTVPISYGTIKFVSGVLAGQQFEVEPEGSFIGRDNNLSQIVVADPRISKRHLWIGVRDGVVRIADQDSRNGTFINDPKSDRITEAALNSGDTVIMGESDVARFEYQM